jgi:phosphoribosylglycinamide formyltransferase 2
MTAACARMLGVEKIFMVDHHPYRLEFARQTYDVVPINFDDTDPAEFIVDNTAFRGVDAAIDAIGLPCVVKPLMSSSGKGQSVIRSYDDIDKAWQYAMSGTRGDLLEVIVEAFVKFESEITLLTVTQKNGKTLFCPPIGHRQERGDYQESWMPHPMTNAHLNEAEEMADKVTRALGGAGIWGVEFFLAEDGVCFSELSPRPHDTGMVTLANTLPLNEFELHLRAVLGLPIPDITLQKAGASAVVLAGSEGVPHITGLEDALNEALVDVKVFGKPVTRPYRRMAVALAWDKPGTDIKLLVAKAQSVAAKVKVQ